MVEKDDTLTHPMTPSIIGTLTFINSLLPCIKSPAGTTCESDWLPDIQEIYDEVSKAIVKTGIPNALHLLIELQFDLQELRDEILVASPGIKRHAIREKTNALVDSHQQEFAQLIADSKRTPLGNAGKDKRAGVEFISSQDSLATGLKGNRPSTDYGANIPAKIKDSDREKARRLFGAKQMQSVAVNQSCIEAPYYANIERILKYLIAEFRKVKNYNSEIFYTKAVVSEEDDIRVLWHRHFWYRKKTDDLDVWPNYTAYSHEEYRRIYGPIHFPGSSEGEKKDLAPYPPELEIQPPDEEDQEEKPQTIAYGTLSGTNIIKGEVLIKSAIEKAIKFLLLMHYYPQRMPDSDTFFEWFPHFASQADVFKSSVRFDEDEDIVYWYEFLLKLSLEHGSLINGEKPIIWKFPNMDFEPLVQEIQTDIYQASILALEFLLEKTKTKTEERRECDALLEKTGQIILKRSDFGKRNSKAMRLLEDLEGKRPGEKIVIDKKRHGTDAVKTLQRACPQLNGKIHKKGNAAYSDVIIKLEA